MVSVATRITDELRNALDYNPEFYRYQLELFEHDPVSFFSQSSDIFEKILFNPYSEIPEFALSSFFSALEAERQFSLEEYLDRELSAQDLTDLEEQQCSLNKRKIKDIVDNYLHIDMSQEYDSIKLPPPSTRTFEIHKGTQNIPHTQQELDIPDSPSLMDAILSLTSPTRMTTPDEAALQYIESMKSGPQLMESMYQRLGGLFHLLYKHLPEQLQIQHNQNSVVDYELPRDIRQTIVQSKAYPHLTQQKLELLLDELAPNLHFKILPHVRAIHELSSREVFPPMNKTVHLAQEFRLSEIKAAVYFDQYSILCSATLPNAKTFEEKAIKNDLHEKDILMGMLINDSLRRGKFKLPKTDSFATYAQKKFDNHPRLGSIINRVNNAQRSWYVNTNLRNLLYLTPPPQQDTHHIPYARVDLDGIAILPSWFDTASLIDDPFLHLQEDQWFNLDYALQTNTLTPTQVDALTNLNPHKVDLTDYFFPPPKEIIEQIFCTRILRHFSCIKDRLKEYHQTARDHPHHSYLKQVLPLREEKLRTLIQGTAYEHAIIEELAHLELDLIRN